MTPLTIALIAIPSAAALAWMWWEFKNAPLIEDAELPQSERDGRRTNETERQRLDRISKLPR